jgi:hypothetical protein
MTKTEIDRIILEDQARHADQESICWECVSTLGLKKAYDGVSLCLKCRIKEFFYKLFY